MTPSIQHKPADIDIKELLLRQRQVAVIWNIDDVQSVRPDLTDNQAWDVLQRCKFVHDCEVGFNWLLIEIVADDMYPRDAIEGEQ